MAYMKGTTSMAQKKLKRMGVRGQATNQKASKRKTRDDKKAQRKGKKKTARKEKAKKEREKTKKDNKTRVELAPTVEFLHRHVTKALCDEVFRGIRSNERERLWSLFSLARFWQAVVLTGPPSLTQLLEVTRSTPIGLLPHVEASSEAFFQKCKNFNSEFFSVLYACFVENILPEAPTSYASEFSHLLDNFSSVQIIDGSKLDKIAHRLKITWKDRSVLLPGCLTAVYDMFRGIASQLWFYADAASSEHEHGITAIDTFAEGTLLLGDRLYCNLQVFSALDARDSFGIFRRNKTLKITEVKKLSSRRFKGGKLEDWLVEAGSQKPRKLRLIRLKLKGKIYEALTNDLEPNHLKAEDIALLYPVRWQVERLFFDLKVVLNLKKFYTANPNGVAMQVFATAMVHVAFRVAQADIAQKVNVTPEEISTKKLYPRLSLASITIIEAEFVFAETCNANPGKKLKKPDWRKHPQTQTTLEEILVERRNEKRKKRRYCKSRGRWKSITRVPGAKKLS
jgi:hypothetical protein